MQQWGADRIHELVELVADAAPGEDLSGDELITACYEQPGVVLGTAAGDAVVSLGLRRARDGGLVAGVRLVAVAPRSRRTGVGRALLTAAETWARQRGAERMELGGDAAFSLWPGVESGGALAALAAACGFTPGLEVRAHAVPVAFRAPSPAGVVVRRAVCDVDVTAVTLTVASMWPQLSDEVARALDHGTCHVAVADDEREDGAGSEGSSVRGIGCHSVTRAGWVGPLVVPLPHRRRGIGSALLGGICRDLMIAEIPVALVASVSDPGVEAFLDTAGAEAGVSRHPMRKDLNT